MNKPKHSKSEDARSMKAGDFKRWRKMLGLNQKEAADALGLKRRVVQYYEKGERDGKKIDIPKYVRLACFALSKGVSDYIGPEENDRKRPRSEKTEKPAKDAKTERPDKQKKRRTKAGTSEAAKPARNSRPQAAISNGSAPGVRAVPLAAEPHAKSRMARTKAH